MKKIIDSGMSDNLYHEKLKNGMDVYILHKKMYYKTVANLTVKFGSIDDYLLDNNNNKMAIPMGTAHFLEHQMFENHSKKKLDSFSSDGAKINAFTNFKFTSFSLVTTNNILKGLNDLMLMYNSLDISNDHLEKEKKIIAQEINLYNDNPDWISRFTILGSLYKHSAIKNNIAGDSESLNLINEEILKESYRYFYHPENTKLFIATSLDPEIILKTIKNTQNKNRPIIFKRKLVENKSNIIPKKEIALNVSIPKIYIGYKVPIHYLQDSTLENELALDIFFESLFSQKSKRFQKMITGGLINTTINWSINLEKEYGFVIINCDSINPQKASNEIIELISDAQEYGIQDTYLNFTKRKKIGEYLSQFNSLEYISNKFSQYIFKDENILTTINKIAKLKPRDINKLAVNWLKKENQSILIVNNYKNEDTI